MGKKGQILSALVAFLCVTYPVYGDDILEAINEGIDAYKEKAYSEAIESLDYAKQLIQQLQGENIIQYLPDALPGWQANTAQSQSMGMLGGMASVQRSYWKAGKNNRGRSEIDITILGKSPMMQGMMAMFNPMVVGTDGGKLQRIKRNKAIVKYDPDAKEGEIHIQVEDRFIVTIKGNSVEKEDLLQYAETVDYKGLKAF